MTQSLNPQIDAGLVKKLVTSQFPKWSNLRIVAVEPGGWDNRTFRLGDSMGVRLPSAEGYALQAEKEQRWLPILAQNLPLPVPLPLGLGKPSVIFPWHWSVYRWLPGEPAAERPDSVDNSEFATSLANFLTALHHIDSRSGPVAGPHNFHRGDFLSVYEPEVIRALSILRDSVEIKIIKQIWDCSVNSRWSRSPVWVHGDISLGNLLVTDGKLSGVIDFGCLGVGDPACDLVIAWNSFASNTRSTFRKALKLDDATWERGRGWALWKALIILAGLPGTNPKEIGHAKKVLSEILDDFQSKHP